MNTSIHNRIIDDYLNKIDKSLIKGKTIIDYGCGDGYAAYRFEQLGAAEVVGYDPFSLFTWQSETKNAKYIYDKSLIKPKYFDIVWCHHVIEHIPNLFKFLEDIHDSIKDDGWLWLACPNAASCSVYSPGHVHNIIAPQLIEILKRTGYGVEDASISANTGQLRVRVPKLGSSEYPKPMADSLNNTGRCPANKLESWNW